MSEYIIKRLCLLVLVCVSSLAFSFENSELLYINRGVTATLDSNGIKLEDSKPVILGTDSDFKLFFNGTLLKITDVAANDMLQLQDNGTGATLTVHTINATTLTGTMSDVELAALASTTSAANKVPYYTGSGTASTTDFTAGGRALVGVTGATDKLAYFTSSSAVSTTDLTTAGRALLDDAAYTNQQATLHLTPGTDVQAYDGELSALAGLTSAENKVPYFTGAGTASVADLTAAGRALLDDAAYTNQQATLHLTPGTDVQAYDGELAALAGLTSAADKLPYFTGSGTAAVTDITSTARGILDDTTNAAICSTIGVGTEDIVSVTSLTGTSGLAAGVSDTSVGTLVLNAGTTTLGAWMSLWNAPDEDTYEEGYYIRADGDLLIEDAEGNDLIAFDDQTHATTVAGKLITPASAAVAGAGFNLPHGVAPNSPVNGDLWTTTAGVFVRKDGVTEQLTVASGGAFSTLSVTGGGSIGTSGGGLNVGSTGTGADDGEVVVAGTDAGAYALQAPTLYTSGAATITGALTAASASNAITLGTSCSALSPPDIGSTTPNGVWANELYARNDSSLGGEILVNGDCEATGTWVSVNTPTAQERSTEVAPHGGTYEWKLTADGGGDGVKQVLATMYPGARVKIVFWVRCDASTLSCRYTVENSTYQAVTATTTWQEVTYYQTITTYGAVFQVWANAAGTFYIDDCSVKLVGGDARVNGTFGVGGNSYFTGTTTFQGKPSSKDYFGFDDRGNGVLSTRFGMDALATEEGNPLADGPNDAFGYQALMNCTGYGNLAVGTHAGLGVTSALGTVSIGWDCNYAGTGTGVIGIGSDVFYGGSADYATGIGYGVGYGGAGTKAVAVGSHAAYAGLAAYSAILGANAGHVSNATGDCLFGYGAGAAEGGTDSDGYNTILGYRCADNINGAAHCIAIGDDVNLASASADYQLNIGATITGDVSTKILSLLGNGANIGSSSTATADDNELAVGVADQGSYSISCASIYATGDISALTFTDRASAYKGDDALAEIAAVCMDDDDVFHETLPESVKRPIYSEKTITDQYTGNTSTVTVTEAGWDLGGMVAVLTASVQQLKAENDDLLARLEKLEKKSESKSNTPAQVIGVALLGTALSIGVLQARKK